jgi:putative membrane protein
MKIAGFIEPSCRPRRIDTHATDDGVIRGKGIVMMGWYGDGWGAGWMVVMLLGWVALLGFGVWAVVALTRGRGPATPEPRAVEPRAILDRRLAAGEITAEEYAQVRRLLDAPAPPPAPTPPA